jgi:hypothetical protein
MRLCAVDDLLAEIGALRASRDTARTAVVNAIGEYGRLRSENDAAVLCKVCHKRDPACQCTHPTDPTAESWMSLSETVDFLFAEIERLRAEVERVHAVVGSIPHTDESDRVWMAWALKLKEARQTREHVVGSGEACPAAGATPAPRETAPVSECVLISEQEKNRMIENPQALKTFLEWFASLTPEQVFPRADLVEWALKHGFVQKFPASSEATATGDMPWGPSAKRSCNDS